ncbi:MFS transporter [Vibrio sp. Isolate30]|nr:MFS transporter [Vibrio sp. Isolate30]MCG9629582.1 MFS transporter [Vibrio sp. Isolate30]
MSIGLISALMGIGQNGLLVSLPFLVERSAFDLPTWSALIAVGSLLFLPSAPFWGRYSDKHGPNRVVIQALVGMTISFLLLAVFSMVSLSGNINVTLCFLGLIVARVIYGCTVSGMVPASQHWAIILCGEQHRLKAITAVSIGLSSGRLLGPVVSILALKLNPFAPLFLMVLLPFIALILALILPIPTVDSSPSYNKKSQPWLPNKSLSPYLISGLLLCASVALLQYSLSPLIYSFTEWPSEKLSDAIGVLLSISAAMTLFSQVWIVKKEKVTTRMMYWVGSIAFLVGMSLFTIPQLLIFGLAMAVTSVGAALLVPAYTASATDKWSCSPGAVAGYISMSHTIGYGVAAMLAFSVVIEPLYPIYLCIFFSIVIVALAYWTRAKKTQSVSESSA